MLATRMLMSAATRIASVPYSGDFETTDNDYSTWTPSGAGDSRTIYTRSIWYKRESTGSEAEIFSAGSNASTDIEEVLFRSDNKIQYTLVVSSSLKLNYRTTATYADTASWHHLLITRSGATVKMYHDGDEITAFDVSTAPGAADTGFFHHNVDQSIGRRFDGANYFDGLLCECVGQDGVAGSIGQFYSSGLPADASGVTFGTNGFLVSDLSTGTDTSGSSNNFTSSGVAQSTDTPTGGV